MAEDCNKKIVGYVLAKIEEESEGTNKIHGHITSISVLRSHRKLGIANKLMSSTHRDMQDVYECSFCSLHVRVSNRAALGLYRDKLGYIIYDVERGYYADHEDAYNMIKYFKPEDIPKETPYDLYLLQEKLNANKPKEIKIEDTLEY